MVSFSFGASAPAFGASSAPAFGVASTVGALQTPASSAFGTAASTTSAFGAPGTAATPSPFGLPAAGAAASTPSLFGGSTTPSFFGASTAAASAPGAASTSSFSFLGGLGGTAASQPAPAGSLLALSAGTAAAAAPGGGQQQPVTAITYTTKYEDLHPNIQKELQDIQREISAYRDDCDKLERDQRLHDSTALKQQSMEEETQALKQALQGLANAINLDDEAQSDFRENVMRLLRCTESAVRTFQRAKLWREAPQHYKGQLVPPQVQELLSAPVVLPNPYLEMSIQGFTDALDMYRQVVCELEAALPPDALASSTSLLGHGGRDPLGGHATTLPIIISHMHDYFVHVAAQLEQVHNEVERSKSSFLAQRQAAGDLTNPFQDSRRHQKLVVTSGEALAFIAAAPAAAQHPHHHAGSHHHGMAHGHGAGHPLHAGTAHGPGGTPMPGAFGTPLAGADGAGLGAAAGADMSRKQSKAGRRR